MKRTRETLKNAFVKNAIPTESDFADLIDSSFNQEDDGISKASNDALSITATGDDEKLINFFRDGTTEPTWQLKQNPGRPGFAITDSTGLRLFIDSATGNVGIGTNQPAAHFVVGDPLGAAVSGTSGGAGVFGTNIAIGEGGANDRQLYTPYTNEDDYGYAGMHAAWGKLYFYTHEGNTTADAHVSPSPQMAIHPNGNVGIGLGRSAPATKLHVQGGDILWGNNSHLRSDQGGSIELGGDRNTAGAGTPYIDFHFRDKKEDYNARIINDADKRLRIQVPNLYITGNVGIGTTSPTTKLHVHGDISTNVAMISDNAHGGAYAAFSHRKHGTAGGYALLQHSGGTTYLNAPTGQSIRFRINNADKMVLGSNGNIGIGTTNPADKLDVYGHASLGMGIANSHFPWRGNGWAYISGKGIIFRSDAAGSHRERMRIEENGDVKIHGKLNGRNVTAAAKFFRIAHPSKPGHDLVHGCIEGPELAVYYRGESQLKDGRATVALPEYFSTLTRSGSATVQLTSKGSKPFLLSYTDIVDGAFHVHGLKPDGAFSWEVKAVRADVDELETEVPAEKKLEPALA